MTKIEIAKNLLIDHKCETCSYYSEVKISISGKKYGDKCKSDINDNTCENWEEIPEYKMSFFNNASIDGKEINNIRCSVTWKKK